LLQHDNASLGPHKPPWRQLRSWISPSYNTRHTVHRLCTMRLPPVSQNVGRPWTSVWHTWIGGKNCENLTEKTKCGVLSCWLCKTCPLLLEVRGEWWRWLCGEVNKGGKRAHYKNYFSV
jgi:hypothetical protein